MPVLVSQSSFNKFSLCYSTLIIHLAMIVLSVPLVIAGAVILYLSEFYQKYNWYNVESEREGEEEKFCPS